MFAYFERSMSGHQFKAFPEKVFPSIQEALAFLGDKVIDFEISEDGQACDLFAANGIVYAIEPIKEG